jgi:U3 small nucleolar RNA-associated protein 20
VHVPSAFAQASFDQDLEVRSLGLYDRTCAETFLQDNQSHFYEALEHWRQLNLSPAFVKFAGRADGLSASMPLLVHNWKEILELWLEAIKDADDEALRALLECVVFFFLSCTILTLAQLNAKACP